MKQLFLALLLLSPALAQEIRLATNWFPEPEFGGYYAALQDGLYQEAGLEVEILPGGPQVNPLALLATGQVEIAISDAEEVFFARGRGIPVVAVFALFQESPRGFMYHNSDPLDDFADLAGRTVATTPGATLWKYIEATYGLAGRVQVVNNPGTLAPWLQDPKMVTQMFVTAEPYFARSAGADPGWLPVSDSGFAAYESVLVVREDFAQQHPETLQAFVTASRRGWQSFLAAPAQYAATLIEANPNLDPEFIEWSAQQMRPLIEAGGTIGIMELERWQKLADQLGAIELLSGKPDPAAAFKNYLSQP